MQKKPQREGAVEKFSELDIKALPADGGERFNRLIFDRSPYLLQHAENPVDWYPWGEEAFARAQAEDRPVFLSIGYSTCHWCHVMAHESFEDDEVARVLNRHFIAVKVDREERPDIDNTYMTVCQMMTGSGGWPLTALLTPDKKPFFTATYLPKTTRGGTMGLIPLLEKIAELWLTDKDRLTGAGENVRGTLLQIDQAREDERPLQETPLLNAYQHLSETFDRDFAGFGPAPKFPMPHNTSLLLRLWQRFGEENAKVMALQTLQAIRLGGIYDQLGFGIHRYSVDSRWLVPHFEKMLYDQALAILAFVDAWQVGGDEFYRQTALEIIDYIARDLTDPDGGFYCGEDADSEGAEGTFYLWTPAQVTDVLGNELGAVFCHSYDVTEQGNFEGRNILHMEADIDALAGKVGVEPEKLGNLLAEGRSRLFAARQERIRPHRDDKILTGWTGLTIAALSRAAAAFNDRQAMLMATRAADFVLEKLRRDDGRLLRRYRRGEAAIPAFLEDYAFFTWGLIDLYQAGFETRYLEEAFSLCEGMERLFGDGHGSLFNTGEDAETVLTRGKSLQDGAIPSGISVTALNLLRLGRITGEPALQEQGERLIKVHLFQVERYPSAYAQFLIALDFALGPNAEIVLAGRADEDIEPFLNVLRRQFLPRTVVLQHRPGDGALEQLAAPAQGKGLVNGQPAAYLCRAETCREPVTSPADLARMLGEK
jgi:uncharacterized protein